MIEFCQLKFFGDERDWLIEKKIFFQELLFVSSNDSNHISGPNYLKTPFFEKILKIYHKIRNNHIKMCQNQEKKS